MEMAGIMTYTAASHQGATEMFLINFFKTSFLPYNKSGWGPAMFTIYFLFLYKFTFNELHTVRISK